MWVSDTGGSRVPAPFSWPRVYPRSLLPSIAQRVRSSPPRPPDREGRDSPRFRRRQPSTPTKYCVVGVCLSNPFLPSQLSLEYPFSPGRCAIVSQLWSVALGPGVRPFAFRTWVSPGAAGARVPVPRTQYGRCGFHKVTLLCQLAQGSGTSARTLGLVGPRVAGMYSTWDPSRDRGAPARFPSAQFGRGGVSGCWGVSRGCDFFLTAITIS